MRDEAFVPGAWPDTFILLSSLANAFFGRQLREEKP
jgi:hypothetical protein